MEGFVALVLASGPAGLISGLGVLVAVFLLARGGVVASGAQKQAANVVLSILLSGVSLLDPQPEAAVTAAIASVGSALAYEFLRGGLPKLFPKK